MSRNIYQDVFVYCKREGLFQKGDGVVVGVSGGADSIFLLKALLFMKEHFSLRLCVVHVNHGIRGEEAKADEAYTCQFAKEAGVPCRVFHAEIPKLAREWHMSEEEAGRKFRYDCFYQAAKEMEFQKIAVAHHQDDQAETVLFQLLRGSSLRGMGGMRSRRGQIVRPLLGIGRRDIEEALKKEQVTYCTDSTNNEDIYARNLLRHHVIPYLKENIQKETVPHICRTAAQMQEIMEYIEGQVSHAYQELFFEEDGKLGCDAAAFIKQHTVIKKELILLALEKMTGKRKDITSEHIEAVCRLAEKQTGKQIDLPYGIVAYREYNQLLFTEKKDSNLLNESMETKTLVLGQSYEILEKNASGSSVVFSKKDISEFSLKNLKNLCTKCFDYDKMNVMPILRHPLPGDYFWLDRSGRKKRLSRLLIDEKVPVWQRKTMWVLAEKDHVLWIPYLGRCSAYYYISETTKTVLAAERIR